MTYEEQIDNILDWFDFDKVHKVMVALNWTWYTIQGVPEVGDLRKHARSLLKSVAMDEAGVTLESGGLEASKNHRGTLRLKFIVESWDAEE